jgi:hypothetical protein
MNSCCCCGLCGPSTWGRSCFGECLGIGRSESGFGSAGHWLAAGGPAGDALALAGGKIGLVDKPMLAKRSSLESGLDFLEAVFWMGAFSCPDL